MARWAATPSTWEFRNDVAALTSVAAPAAMASFGSRSQLCLVITSSIRYFVVVGRTKSDKRLMIISRSPNARRLRCFQMSARASSQAPCVTAFFFCLGSSTWSS
jgi:hypothetical protein